MANLNPDRVAQEIAPKVRSPPTSLPMGDDRPALTRRERAVGKQVGSPPTPPAAGDRLALARDPARPRAKSAPWTATATLDRGVAPGGSPAPRPPAPGPVRDLSRRLLRPARPASPHEGDHTPGVRCR